MLDLSRLFDPFLTDHRRHHPPHHHHPHPHTTVWLIAAIAVGEGRHLVTEIQLKPGETVMAAAQTLPVGHVINCALVVKDSLGAVIASPPAFDAPPVWSNTAPTVDSLVAAATGLTAVDTALAAGSDTVTVTGSFSGVAMTATMPVTVTAQVPASIDIVPTVV